MRRPVIAGVVSGHVAGIGVAGVTAAIRRDGWNDRCEPFTWTKPADEILAARDRLGERRPPGRCLEGVGEVLGLVRYQAVGELHDAHRVGGRAVIGDDALAHPQVAAAGDPQGGEVAFGRVPAGLAWAATACPARRGSPLRSAAPCGAILLS
jgi:hypothetical protein